MKTTTPQNEITVPLQQGLAALKIEVSDQLIKTLTDYIAELCKWNSTYNLTAVRDPLEIVSRHILDSMSISHYLQGQRILDVGTGAGFPGIPLALLHPEKNFVLLDSNGKKTRFLIQCIHKFGVKNVEVLNTRAETYTPTACFDSVVTRAFSSINEMLALTQNLCCRNGRFLAMKGAYPKAELEELDPNFTVESVLPLQIPGLNAERHLVIIKLASS